MRVKCKRFSQNCLLLVLSGSMEPAFYRGDLLFLINPRNTPYVVGDITVYKIPGADIPIVHRVIETHQTYVFQFRITVDPYLTSSNLHVCFPEVLIL